MKQVGRVELSLLLTNPNKPILVEILDNRYLQLCEVCHRESLNWMTVVQGKNSVNHLEQSLLLVFVEVALHQDVLKQNGLDLDGRVLEEELEPFLLKCLDLDRLVEDPSLGVLDHFIDALHGDEPAPVEQLGYFVVDRLR